MTDTYTNNKAAELEALVYSEGGEMFTAKLAKALDINLQQLTELCSEYNSVSKGLRVVNDGKRVALKVAGE